MGCSQWLRRGVVGLLAVFLFVGGVHLWLHKKSYIFSAEEISSITHRALKKTKGMLV